MVQWYSCSYISYIRLGDIPYGRTTCAAVRWRYTQGQGTILVWVWVTAQEPFEACVFWFKQFKPNIIISWRQTSAGKPIFLKVLFLCFRFGFLNHQPIQTQKMDGTPRLAGLGGRAIRTGGDGFFWVAGRRFSENLMDKWRFLAGKIICFYGP